MPDKITLDIIMVSDICILNVTGFHKINTAYSKKIDYSTYKRKA